MHAHYAYISLQLENQVTDLKTLVAQLDQERDNITKSHELEIKEAREKYHNITTELRDFRIAMENHKVSDDKKYAKEIEHKNAVLQIQINNSEDIEAIKQKVDVMQDRIERDGYNEEIKMRHLDAFLKQQLNEIRSKMNTCGQRSFADQISGFLGSVVCLVLPGMRMCQQRVNTWE